MYILPSFDSDHRAGSQLKIFNQHACYGQVSANSCYSIVIPKRSS